MIYVKTKSGSLYAVDDARRKYCRVLGRGEPTPRTGDSWTPFIDRSDIRIGQSLLLIHPDNVPHEPGTTPGTLTTAVVSFEAGADA